MYQIYFYKAAENYIQTKNKKTNDVRYKWGNAIHFLFSFESASTDPQYNFYVSQYLHQICY